MLTGGISNTITVISSIYTVGPATLHGGTFMKKMNVDSASREGRANGNASRDNSSRKTLL
jgi:hypothetical protein